MISKLQNLRSFALTGIDINCNMLVQWLRSSSASIARIRLENIDLLQGHWIGFSESLRSIGFDQLLSLELLEVGTSGEEIVRLLDEDSDINFVWGWDPKRSELCDYVRQKTSTNPYIEF